MQVVRNKPTNYVAGRWQSNVGAADMYNIGMLVAVAVAVL